MSALNDASALWVHQTYTSGDWLDEVGSLAAQPKNAPTFNEGWVLNGTTQYLEVLDSATLKPGSGQFSVAVWAVTANVAQTGVPAGKAAGFTSAGWIVDLFSGDHRFNIGLPRLTPTASGASLSNNVEFVLTGTRDASNVNAYANTTKVSVAVGGLGSVDNAETLLFGQNAATRHFTGTIKGVSFWNGRAISDSEVAGLLNDFQTYGATGGLYSRTSISNTVGNL